MFGTIFSHRRRRLRAFRSLFKTFCYSSTRFLLCWLFFLFLFSEKLKTFSVDRECSPWTRGTWSLWTIISNLTRKEVFYLIVKRNEKKEELCEKRSEIKNVIWIEKKLIKVRSWIKKIKERKKIRKKSSKCANLYSQNALICVAICGFKKLSYAKRENPLKEILQRQKI